MKRQTVTIHLHPQFLELARRNRLSPELLARLWCDELSQRQPSALTILSHRPLKELEAEIAAKRRKRKGGRP